MVVQDKEFECNVHEKRFGDSSRWLMVQKSASKSIDDISVEDKFDSWAKYYTTALLILQKWIIYLSVNCEACLFAELLKSAHSSFEQAQVSSKILRWWRSEMKIFYKVIHWVVNIRFTCDNSLNTVPWC